jgi:ubiquinone/menaquinone biosynthesis C-methylase UbiE
VTVERFARSFGRVASLYDDARPDWPAEAIDRPVQALGLTSAAEVVDLAAGTGKLTRRLVERFARVVAVEPDDRMRALLEETTPSALAREGTAERTMLPDSSADAVFVADAFHWFAGAAAVSEIARVLRPRGGLVLLWNEWWKLDPGLPDAARQAFEEVWVRTGRAEAQGELEDWRTAFEGSAFEELAEARIQWQLELPAERVVSLYLTPSGAASLPDDERDELRHTLERALSGTYRLPIETLVAWTRLR